MWCYVMPYVINIEDAVANAFIKYDDKRSLSLSIIEDYANDVRKELNRNNANVIINFSRNETNRMLEEYGDFFILNENTIFLTDNINKIMLIEKFRGYLPLELLKAFCSV